MSDERPTREDVLAGWFVGGITLADAVAVMNGGPVPGYLRAVPPEVRAEMERRKNEWEVPATRPEPTETPLAHYEVRPPAGGG